MKDRLQQLADLHSQFRLHKTSDNYAWWVEGDMQEGFVAVLLGPGGGQVYRQRHRTYHEAEREVLAELRRCRRW